MDKAASDPPGSIDLRSAAFSGGRWSLIESVGQQLSSSIATVVLARLLVPADFGLVAVVMIVVNLLQVFVEVGISASLVQRKEVDSTLLSTMFWASVGLGGLGAGVTAALAVPLAASFGHGEAAPLIGVASVMVLFSLANGVPNSLLMRALRFRERSLLAVSSSATYLVIAIVLAAAFDLGAWSIVIGRVVASAVLLMSTAVVAGWVPALRFEPARLKEDLGFNAGFLGMRVVTYFSKNVDYWAVGRRFGESALGAYYVAYVLPNIVRQRMTWAAERALFPVLTRMRAERSRFAHAYRDALQFVALIAFPALIGLAAITERLVPIVFGDQWDAAIRPMQVLALAAALDALSPLVTSTLMADGVPGWNAVVTLIRVVALAVGLWVALMVGEMVAVAWAVFVGTGVAVMMSQFVIFRRLPIGVRELVQALFPVLIPTAAMVVAVLGYEVAVRPEGLWQLPSLVLSVTLGVGMYFGVGFVLHRRVFGQLLKDLRSAIGR